ncbi:hypothetical protein CMV_026526 [Castanea mollissima]|uniref:Uncharacterized protein n=1 Tax=Castanea mollissima TaxID=60419 RepID=A0A8J4QJV0_9ROSI|nr:hypothetical protein CMV_026526 [Castanea mollissima]
MKPTQGQSKRAIDQREHHLGEADHLGHERATPKRERSNPLKHEALPQSVILLSTHQRLGLIGGSVCRCWLLSLSVSDPPSLRAQHLSHSVIHRLSLTLRVFNMNGMVSWSGSSVVALFNCL